MFSFFFGWCCVAFVSDKNKRIKYGRNINFNAFKKFVFEDIKESNGKDNKERKKEEKNYWRQVTVACGKYVV